MSALRSRDMIPSSLALRPARRSDVEAILAMERASFTDPWSRAAFTSLLGHPGVYFVVAARPDEGIAGYLAAWFMVPEGEIATLAVDTERRRLGVGGLLLDSAIQEARLRGVRDLYLEVRDSNAAAQKLYASRGFLEIGRRRLYYRNPAEDARMLRLHLG